MIIHWDFNEDQKENSDKVSEDTSSTLHEIIKMKDLLRQLEDIDKQDFKIEIDKEIWHFSIKSKEMLK